MRSRSPCSEDYEFALFNLDKECYYKDVSVNFKPLWDEREGKYLKTHPEFNFDYNYWSPAFLVQAEAVRNELNQRADK